MTDTGAASLSIPKRFPVMLEDRILYWMRNSFDSCIRCVVAFDGRVDAARLARAVRLTLDAEPVLGCRFVRKPFKQYWERMDDPDGIKLFEVLETSEYDGNIGAFMAAAPCMDLYNGPQVRAWLVRSEKDTLVVSIQHVACDGGALKEYLSLLASIYRNLSGDPGYCPKPNVSGDRSLRQIFQNFGPGDYFRIMRRGFRDVYEFMFPLVRRTPASMNKPSSHMAMMLRTIGPDIFRKFREYGRRHDATVNDMLVTAFLRAFFGPENPGENLWPRVVGTVDLRRYIPEKKGGALCNLSGFTYLSIGPRLGASFYETLSLVQGSLGDHKSDFIGLGALPLSGFLFGILPLSAAIWVHDRMGNAQKKQASSGRDVAPLLTNMGSIDAGEIGFGDAGVISACLTTPIATPPVLAVGLTGFGESITISAGFCETTVKSDEVKRILDNMEKEISSLT
jgi:NRPS condensation-like uncharacterized protein